MPGRSPDTDLEERFLAAAWKLLSRDGYEAMTMVHVAAAAGAHQTDIYRRWPNKVRLATAALAAHLPPVSEVDTGSLHSDLRAWVEDLAQSWSSPWIDGLIGAVADLRTDAEAEQIFRRMAEQRGRQLERALERALDRGEISQMPDKFLLGDLLEGPLMHRRVFGGSDLGSDYLDTVTLSAYRTLTAAAAAVHD